MEIIGVITVVGIMASIAVSKWAAFQKSTKLEGEAHALFSEIANARSQAMKRDAPYLILFDLKANAYSIYCDSNRNGSAESGELVSRKSLDRQVAFGAPSGGPSVGPASQGKPANKIEGGWINSLVLANDRIATINAGSLYLFASGSKKTLCIRMPVNGNKLELWRWDASQWASML